MSARPLLLLVIAMLSCARPPRMAPVPVVAFAVDTARAQPLRAGVTRWFLYAPEGPWAIHALVVDRDACYSALAVKGADGAVGREKTSDILTQLRRSADVAGGIPDPVLAETHFLVMLDDDAALHSTGCVKSHQTLR